MTKEHVEAKDPKQPTDLDLDPRDPPTHLVVVLFLGALRLLGGELGAYGSHLCAVFALKQLAALLVLSTRLRDTHIRAAGPL